MKPAHLKIVFFFAVAVLISYMILIIMGDNGLRDLNAMKQQLSNIKAKNEKIQEKNIEMNRKIKRLKEDPEFVENIARQDLKMIGKDEIVFKFKEDSPDNKQQMTTTDTPPSKGVAGPSEGDHPLNLTGQGTGSKETGPLTTNDLHN